MADSKMHADEIDIETGRHAELLQSCMAWSTLMRPPQCGMRPVRHLSGRVRPSWSTET